MSPELLYPDKFGSKHGQPTKGSDCYALGMVILEVLSGRVPFAQFKDFIVMRKVIKGELPEIPEGPEGVWFTDDLWQMLNRCWMTKPGSRPTIGAVLEFLERVSRTWKPPSPRPDEDAEMDKDGSDFTTVSDSFGVINCSNPTTTTTWRDGILTQHVPSTVTPSYKC